MPKISEDEKLVSIIIPLHWGLKLENNKRFLNDLKKYLLIRYKKYEIILVTDKPVHIPFISKKIRHLVTHLDTSPAEKRDFALNFAKGEICAFIDDDAYPDKNWLKQAINIFKNSEIVAVGGPGITPPEDSYWEQLSGLVYESFFCGGAAQYRFISLPARYVDDYPAYNLLVRTNTLKEVGGYGNKFYGGEDTFLCLKLIKKGKIYYDPDVIVFHHRRKLYIGLLKQIANVGLHRGFFAKKFPQTSRKWFYFLPSILTISSILYLMLAFYNPVIMFLFIGTLALFIFIGAMSIIDKTSFKNALLIGMAIILVHISYGIFFIKGLVTYNLKR